MDLVIQFSMFKEAKVSANFKNFSTFKLVGYFY